MNTPQEYKETTTQEELYLLKKMKNHLPQDEAILQQVIINHQESILDRFHTMLGTNSKQDHIWYTFLWSVLWQLELYPFSIFHQY